MQEVVLLMVKKVEINENLLKSAFLRKKKKKAILFPRVV